MSEAATAAPETFGDVTGEYLAMKRAAALVEGRLEVTRVTGPDTVRFLDGLLSQAIEPLPAGGAARSLLLAPQGKLRAMLWVLRAGDGVRLVSDGGRGEVVRNDLNRFRIRVDATVEAGTPVVEVWGPAGADVLAEAGLAAPASGTWQEEGGMVANLPLLSSSLPRFVVDAAHAECIISAGAVRAGSLAVGAVRIEAGEPAVGVDVDETTIPQEAGVVAASVDFTKGCYLGQELVARIDSRGHVNRHLRGLVIAENVIPPLGAEVVADGKEVGTLTSTAESLDLRAPIALALVRREVEPGAAVDIVWQTGHVKAHVRSLPLVG